MESKIVSAKEIKESFRKEALATANVSPSAKKLKRIIGGPAKQLTIDTGVHILNALLQRYKDQGRVVNLIDLDLATPKSLRRYVSASLNGLSKATLRRGANVVETIYKSFGDRKSGV